MESLSCFEKAVLSEYLKGKNIFEVTKKVEKFLKATKYKQVAVDNALFRIHRKAVKLKNKENLFYL